MLKFWPSTPVDLTPRAGPNGQERTNPFETLQPLSTANAAALSARQSQSTQQQQHSPLHLNSGPLTPTAGQPPAFHHQLLNASHHLLSPSISAPAALSPNGAPADLTSPSHHPLPQPYQATMLGPLTPGGSFAQPTTSLSLHAPVFNMQQPPPPKRQQSNAPSQQPPSSLQQQSTPPSTTNQPPSGIAKSASASSSVSANGSITSNASSTASATSSTSSHGNGAVSAASGPSKGQIHVKLISARGLNVRSSKARPYVVVQFEQNEFVSRDPTEESDKEIKGVATNLSRVSSSTALSSLAGHPHLQSNALSALGAISSKLNGRTHGRDSTSTNGKSSKEHTPSSSAGSNKSGLASVFGSRISAHNPVWKHEVSFDVTSEESAITFNVYDRATTELGFLGTVQIKPVLVHDHTVDQWYKLRPYENEPVTGEMRIQVTFEANKTKRALTPRDFEFLKLIGRGTFGRVFQVRKRDTKRIYAMKVLSKREIVAKKEVAHTIGERKILQRSLESPFLVGLKFSFQTDADLYLVTDFKSGGELFWHLQKETRFSEERARFYIAELVLALEHLHKYDIVYRDLKPENILLDATGHVALCDFGLSKPDLRSDELTNTFCGTTEYLAPEVLLDEHGYSKLVDFWSLGVLLFEMCCGWSPFYAEDTQTMYKNICFGKIRFPKGVIGEEGKQFVKGLLNRNPKHRLGAQRDAAELKDHPFFASIDWNLLALKQVTPPFKPVVESDESVDNFDPEFTTADVRDAGPGELFDDEDPSEDWVALSHSQSVLHTPNGPLGSDRPPPPPPTNGHGNGPANGTPKGIEISNKKKRRDVAESPLSNSMQENFRGFTYHGESVIPAGAAGILKEDAERELEEAVNDGESLPGFDTDAEEGLVGRYAHRRRGDTIDGFEEEMNF